MWEVIGQATKVFIEKHLIPTVSSVVATIILFIILPSDYWIIVKIGRIQFAILLFGIFFLIIQLGLFCFQKIRNNKKNQKLILNENQSYFTKEKLEEIWTMVDSFSPQDREIIKDFLKTENAPIKRNLNTLHTGKSIFNSDWIVLTEEYEEKKHEPIKLSESPNTKTHAFNIFDTFDSRTIITKCRLRDDVYAILKYSKDNYRRISHFE